MANLAAVSPVKVDSSRGYPSNAPLADIPTPLRTHEGSREARSSADMAAEAQPACLLDICPWDSLAQCLTLPELEWVCCASSSLHAQLTIHEGAPPGEEPEDPELTQRVAHRKLLAPLLVLKVETAEAELQRVSLSNIKALRIWNHRSLDMLLDALADAGGPQVLRSLEKIALKGCPLSPDVISSFMQPVFKHAQIKHLNLEKNQVTDDHLCDLVKSGVLDAESLESINLRFNRLGSRGVQALASSRGFASLKWVNLKMNGIGDDGAIALAESLHGNTAMSLLNMRRQTPPLTDRSAVAFGEMLKNNSALEQLRLRQNRITDIGATALAEHVNGHVQRLQSFRGVGARFELDLEQNRIKESGAIALLESLTGISKAVRVELLIHGNWVKQDVLMKAAEGADDKTKLTDGRLTFESKAEGVLW